jgi:hypothetical protein
VWTIDVNGHVAGIDLVIEGCGLAVETDLRDFVG